MALSVGDKVVADTTGIRMLEFPSSARPANPVQGQVIYNTTNRTLEVFDGGYWKECYDSNRPFLYRTVITTAYVAGGYKDGVPFRNVNRMLHSTNICTNLGDQISAAFSYAVGACNLTKGFFWSAEGSNGGASVNGIAFNMASETSAGAANNMRAARTNPYAVWKETQFAYIQGGGSGAVDVFNLTNETMYNSAQGPDSLGGDQYGGNAGFSDETAGYTWGDVNRKLLFSTTVSYTISDTSVGGSTSQQKGISTKLGKGYAGNEGVYNGGFNFRRWNCSTDVNIGNVAKPIGNCGEENFDMGQDHQYMLGMYDGLQNNRGWRFSYSTDSGFELGAGSVRTGVPGGSSAQCVWKG
jgi:hypothetical protein